MNILKIARMGHPVLRGAAASIVDPLSPDIQRLIDDMIETMEDYGGVGLAAPQVFHPVRLIIYKIPAARQPGLLEDVPVMALINPVLEPIGESMDLGWEGCLSVPGLRGAVRRYTKLRYSGLDRKGNPVTGEAEHFHARVLQHETDHIDGILYPQQMHDMRLLTFIEESARYPIDLGDARQEAAE